MALRWELKKYNLIHDNHRLSSFQLSDQCNPSHVMCRCQHLHDPQRSLMNPSYIVCYHVSNVVAGERSLFRCVHVCVRACVC